MGGGFNEAVDKYNRFERFGTGMGSTNSATVKPAILIVITLVCIQAISNLVADWNKEDVKHTPADEIDQTEIENIRKTLEERLKMVDVGTLSPYPLGGMFVF